MTARAGVQGTVPSGGQSINAIAAKVRRLSDFASDNDSSAAAANPAVAAAFREGAADQLATAPAVMPPQGESNDALPAPPADVAAKEDSMPVAADTAPTTRAAGPATVAFVAPTQSATGSAAAASNFTQGGLKFKRAHSYCPSMYQGLTGVPFRRISKCKCAPVELPVLPDRPINWPRCTLWQMETLIWLKWA